METEPPLIEPSKTELSRVVTTREIEQLPISGRNFVDFVKLSSGVALGRENVGGGAFKEPDVGVGSAAAPRPSFGGQPELNTLIQVDGADNIQTFTGLPRATPSQEAAKEFRVLNSTYLAEYGRALGGFVNIVTKSGTNQGSGSGYYFGMDDALAARSILNRPGEDTLNQHQFGGTVGGPITADRTFFFGNYEGQLRKQSNRYSQVVLNNLDALNAVRVPLGLRPETTDQVLDNHYNSLLVKLDHHPGRNHTLSIRYNFLDSQTDNFLGGGGRASPTSSTARDNQTRDQALVANVISVLSRRLVNEARFQTARRTFDFSAVYNEPSLDISNFIIMGKSTSDVDYYAETRVQLADSLTWTTGGHQVKAGLDINILRNDSVWNLFFPARIVFPNVAAFQTFSPVVFWWPYLAGAPTYRGSARPGPGRPVRLGRRDAVQLQPQLVRLLRAGSVEAGLAPDADLRAPLRLRAVSVAVHLRDRLQQRPAAGRRRLRVQPARRDPCGVRHLPRPLDEQHRAAVQRHRMVERRIAAERARAVPLDCAD